MATDFFELQDDARKNTGRLVLLFVLAVIAICVTLYALAVVVFAYQPPPPGSPAPEFAFSWWNPVLLAQVSLATLAVVGGGTLFKLAQLRAGGSVVAEALGGRLIQANTSDPVESKLQNVVEEMAIASGTPTPPVYMLDHESGINAFAAGFSLNDAVIGVTRGCAQELSRDELQGVIAHEFSHILNGDMRLNLRLMGVLHGILLLGIIGYFLLRSSIFAGAAGGGSRRDNSGMALLALGAGLLVIGFVGTFFGNLIKASVSRQREFLADASSVQFTRNPRGIAGALKRIGAASRGSDLDSPAAPEASHMFFGRATHGIAGLFSTHPPLEARIARLDPAWDGAFSSAPGATAPTGASELVSGFAGARPATGAAIEQIGQPGPEHLEHAGTILNTIPTALRDAAHDAYGARALVYALVLDRRAQVRDVQLQQLEQHADTGILELTREFLDQVQSLDAALRLALVDLTLPALRALSPNQYQVFSKNLQVLVEADRELDLFEWTLQRILSKHLRPTFAPAEPERIRFRSLGPLKGACRVLLSALARAGQSPQADAGRAFALGAQRLGLALGDPLPHARSQLGDLDRALDQIATATPQVKRVIVHAAADCVAADGKVTVDEAELMRATAVSLGCPMPPLLPGQQLTGTESA